MTKRSADVWRVVLGLAVAVVAMALGALAFAGCARETPTAAAVLTDTTITLAPGEVFAVDGTARVSFLAVNGDSRCPADVVCVWAGNAVVQVGTWLGTGPTTPYDLNTTLDPREMVFGSWKVRLVSLAPAPLSTSTIPPADYRATLLVTHLGPD